MRWPKYKSDLYAYIFMFLGVGFFICGCLSFVKILKPSAHSLVQNQMLLGWVFCALGIAFYVIQAVCKRFGKKRARLDNELISTGTKIVATVESVSLQKGIGFGGKSPFIVSYTYSYQEKVYHHKSCLFWTLPKLDRGDRIEVFVNDEGQSTTELQYSGY